MTGLLGGGHAIYLGRAEQSRSKSRLLRHHPWPRRRAARDRAARGRHRVRERDRLLFGRNRIVRRSGAPSRARGAARGARAPPLGACRRAGPAPRQERRRVPAGARRVPGDDRARHDDERRRADLRSRRPAPPRRRQHSSSRAWCEALELVAEDGPRSAYEGTLADSLLALMDERGGLVTRDDLRAYEAQWSDPIEVPYAGTRFLSRGGLSDLAELLAQLPRLRGLSPAERALVLARALDGPDDAGDTTNLTVVDAEGNACVLTTSLGLGSGDFVPGYDLHLNSMLGETDLIRGPLEPGERMGSMMAPSLALDSEGVALAAGAAGGTRLRSALLQVVSGRPGRGAGCPGRGVAAAAPSGGRPHQPRGRVRAGGRRRRSRMPATRSAPGTHGTTISAASAR